MADLGNRIGGSGPQGRGLDDRVSGIRETQGKLDAAQGAQTPSAVDLLGSPESLMKLGLAVAGGLSGNQNLQALGLGVGMGTLDAASEQARGTYEAQQKQIADLQGTLDKQQARLTTLMQSQPGMFVNEEGEDFYSPEEMGQILGTGVPTSPSLMVARRQQAVLDAANIKAASGLVNEGIKSGNPRMTAKGLHILRSNLPWGNISDRDIEEMASSDRAPTFNDLTKYYTADSVVEALGITQDAGATFLTDEAIEVLVGNPEDADALNLSDPTNKLFWEASKVYRKWISDNPDLVASLTVPQQVEAALADRGDLHAVYTTKLTTARGFQVDPNVFLENMAGGMDIIAKLDMLRSGLAKGDISQDEFDTKYAKVAGKLAAAASLAESVGNSQMTSTLALDYHPKIQEYLIRKHPQLDYEQREHIVGDAIQTAIKRAGGQSINNVIGSKFAEELDKLLRADETGAIAVTEMAKLYE